MSKEVRCAMCLLPITGRAARHYGDRVAHSEHECLRLLRTRIEKLEAENERLKGLLSVAVCPDKNCDNHGTIAVQELVGYNEYGEAETGVDLQQCQWCDERTTLTKEGTNETT